MAFKDPVLKIAQCNSALQHITLGAYADSLTLSPWSAYAGGALIIVRNARDGDEITFTFTPIVGSAPNATRQIWNMIWVWDDFGLDTLEITSIVRRAGEPNFLLGPVTLIVS